MSFEQRNYTAIMSVVFGLSAGNAAIHGAWIAAALQVVGFILMQRDWRRMLRWEQEMQRELRNARNSRESN